MLHAFVTKSLYVGLMVTVNDLQLSTSQGPGCSPLNYGTKQSVLSSMPYSTL